MNKFNQLLVLSLVVVALGATGCGKNANNAAKAMNALGGKSGGSTGTGLRGDLVGMRNKAHGLAYLAAFSGGQMGVTTPDANEDFGCALGSGDGTTAATPYVITCTAAEPESITCGATTYTWAKDGTFTMKIYATSAVLGFGFQIKGTMSGGDFGADGSAIDCSLGYVFDLAKLQAAAQSGDEDAIKEVLDVSCEDTGFACTVGGDTVDCDSIEDSAKDTDNACA